MQPEKLYMQEPVKPIIRNNQLLLGKTSRSITQQIGFKKKSELKVEGDLITNSSEGHIITIGKTGSGKNRNAQALNLLTYPGSCVVIDLKGESHRVTSRLRSKFGKIYRLAPFCEYIHNIARLNPFDLLELWLREALDTHAQNLAHIIGGNSFSSKEPFWDFEGMGLVSGCISAVATTKDKPERNWRSLANMFMNEDVTYSLAVLMDNKSSQLTPMARHEIGSFLSLTDVTRSGVLATATSYLKSLTSEQIINSLCDSTIDLKELVDGKEPFTIYIDIPPTHVQSHSRLIKLWIHVLMTALMTRTEIPEMPTIFFLDELAQLGHFSLLENIVTIGRGYGIRVWMFLQNINQLKANYPNSWTTILGNCDVMQIFAANDFLTAKELGEVTGIEASNFLQMNHDEQYVVINGIPTKAKKLDYLKDEMFKGLYDINPYYNRLTKQINENIDHGIEI